MEYISAQQYGVQHKAEALKVTLLNTLICISHLL